ncbi:MAG TPA: triose-phosphate isomerase [Thermodesulfovibrionales bacterium]|nr:triose-phosphate isomerase [Thermodesulfovibrionales bacterium]
MRRPFIAANWKMNKTVSEAVDFVQSFLPSIRDIHDAEIVIAPSFTALFSVGAKLKGTNVRLSAQNVFYEEKGAFTGEVSLPMIKDAGCDYVIIGHSERRQYFNETDETVNKRIKASVKNGMGVIFCIGETLSQRETGKTYEVLNTQIVNGLKDVNPGGFVVAYEPVWAIGTGKTATAEQAQEAHLYIRNKLRDLYGGTSDSIQILYGGSVTPENVDSLMACPDVDGALVGGASLKPESFERIVKFKRGIK